MNRRYSNARHPRLLTLLCGGFLLTLLLAPAALASTATGPIVWSPADSTFGASSFVLLPAPPGAPSGLGATALMPGPGVAYGSGFWDATNAVFAMGFVGELPSSPGLPTMPQTNLTQTPLTAGTPLTLTFDKASGQKIDSIAILGAPDAPVSIQPSDPAALTAATQFTVRATVTDPVESLSGDVGAAFGLIVDCSTDPGRDFQGSLFVTDLHWLDIDPPTFNTTGLAGLSAHGEPDTKTTFDGILSPAFLATLGVAPEQVQGYVDVTAVTGWTGATFAVLGAGDGSMWPSGYWKYRITNSSWSTHNIRFGRMAETKPARAVGISPKGTIATARPTFKWRKVSGATKYEVRVYKGSTLLLKKTGVTTLSWKATKALPRKVYLTWKVRGVNGSGSGSFSTALKFKIS